MTWKIDSPKIRAQHEERAVRQAHDVHQPEDERQAGRHQEQQHAVDQPVQKLGDKQLHARLSRPFGDVAAGRSVDLLARVLDVLAGGEDLGRDAVAAFR